MGKSINKITERHKTNNQTIEQILSVIHEYIFEGQLKSGDELPSEKDFSDRLGVSRFSLREALRVAQAQGLIEINQGKKPTVAHPSATSAVNIMSLALRRSSEKSQYDLLAAREALESKIARIAAEKITQEDLNFLEETISLMEIKNRPIDYYMSKDREFHNIILKSTGSLVFEIMLSSVTELITETLITTLKSGGIKRAIDSHKKIFNALKKHDPNLAEKEMRSHLLNAEEDLKALEL